MKKISIVIMALLATLGLTACGQKNESAQSLQGKKILVAYFSWSGNTKAAAEHIIDKTGADAFVIERVEPYPASFEDGMEAHVQAESGSKARPSIKGEVANMADYDVVFICTPVWYEHAPMPVFTFMEQYDFTGKTVIPVSTAHSSKYQSHKDIIKATPTADHRDGLEILSKTFGGDEVKAQYAKIDKFLEGLGL